MSSPSNDPVVCRHGHIALASQPREADLDSWAEDGVALVVNSRTPEETAALPFDLAGAVASRGMQYVELPIGGPWGASPELTARLGALLAANPDTGVVLHCETMGWPGSRDMALVQALLPR